MKRKRTTSILLAGAAAILVLALVGGPAAAKPSASARSFHGTVSSVSTSQRALIVNRVGGSPVRFVVRASTTYEHISGLAGLTRGTPVEVKAFSSNERWIATRIEANPDRRHGADDPPGDDHGGARGADDPPGDDHGGARGADDPPGDDHGSDG